MSFHPFAVIKDMAFVRYELDDKGPLAIGEQRLPVEVDPKPDYDPTTEYLDTTPGVDASRGVVRLVYSRHLRKPRPAASPAQTVVVQADTSALERRVADLESRLAAVDAFDMTTALLATVAIAARDKDAESLARLAPVAAKRGVSVEQLIDDLIRARVEATDRAIARAS